MTVSLRIVLSPAPEIFARLLERTLGFPAKLLQGPSRVGSEIEHVTGTTRGNFVRKLAADGFGESVDHFVDSAPTASTQVPGAHAGVVGAKIVQGQQMTVSQVENVNVIADSSAVARGVVF